MKKIITLLYLTIFAQVLVYGQATLAENNTLLRETPQKVKSATTKTSAVGAEYAKPFEININSSVLSGSSLIHINIEEDTDSVRLELFDNKGEPAGLLFDGNLLSGPHQFEFIPASGISKPFIAVLTIATKVASMRVVKFNSF